jgi:TPR repeat protein
MRHMLALILVSGAAIALDAPAAAAPDRAEITYWESVRDSTTPAELEAYLKAYPSGQFAPLAKLRLKTLQGAEKKSDAATEDGGSGAPATDTAKSRTEETSGTESLTLTAKLAKREINGVPRTVLGVNISDLTKYQASCFRVPEATGVLVQNVVADSPASQAGIVGGDIIREFEGKPVKTARGLMDLVSAQPAGVSAKVGVLRPRALRNGAKAIADRAAAGGGGDMLCFAFLQMNGLGAEKNLAEANRWYRKAAEAGVTDAMYNLANHLENGTGIAKDIA